MELSLANRRWLIFVQVSLIGFILLSICLNQGWRPGPVFASLGYRPAEVANAGEELIQQKGVVNETQQKDVEDQRTLSPSPTPSMAEVSLKPETLQPVASPPTNAKMFPRQSEVEKGAAEIDVTPVVSPSPEKLEVMNDSDGMFPRQSEVEKGAADIDVTPAISTSPEKLVAMNDSDGMFPRQSEVEKGAAEIDVTPAISPSPEKLVVMNDSDGVEAETSECDFFDGRWVYDEKVYPLYEGRRCPILSPQVACRKNGRPDSGYEHWRWEAKGCEIPRFNGTKMLEKLRGKRMIIVGDSLNRNQWESLSCMLYSSTPKSRSVFKSGSDCKIYKALDYDFTVEFYWSPFLIPLEGAANHSNVLKLDKLPPMSKHWVGADVMVFNTGHWWTHHGAFQKWTYLEHKGKLVQKMEGDTAFETAMKTWAAWIDRWVDPTKTMVFFRSVSPEHKKENLHWCYNQTTPITSERYIQWFPTSMRSIVERTILEMKTPVKYLNITRLSEFRRDAHTSIYTTRGGILLTMEQRAEPKKYADCSHWCLPGLPDTWNVIIYAYITQSLSILL